MDSVSKVFIIIAFGYATIRSITLIRNIVAARRSELNFVVVPFTEVELLSVFLTPLLRQFYNDYLLENRGWPRWCRFLIRDWAWEDRGRAHSELGNVFLVVSPSEIICYSADSRFNRDAFNRRADFVKPRDKYSKLISLNILPRVELISIFQDFWSHMGRTSLLLRAYCSSTT